MIRLPARAARAGLVLLAIPAGAAAQIPRVDVRWEPDFPVQGRLFRVVVNADMAETLESLRAELAGQPLHFSERSPGEFVALAATPIESEGELLMPVVATWTDGSTDSLTMAVPVRGGEYRLERLTVGPRYGTPPDSALQERMRREAALAREVSERSHFTPRMWESVVHPPSIGRASQPVVQLGGRHVQRRVEVGLGPLADYVTHWDLVWDVETYKNETAKRENKIIEYDSFRNRK